MQQQNDGVTRSFIPIYLHDAYVQYIIDCKSYDTVDNKAFSYANKYEVH